MIDYGNLMEVMFNAEMLKNKEFAPVLKVLNKYGLFGTKAMSFLSEFSEVVEEWNKNQQERNND